MLVLLSGNAEAGFSVRLEPGCDGLRAFFTDLSTGAVSYLWDFGDGTTSTLPSPATCDSLRNAGDRGAAGDGCERLHRHCDATAGPGTYDDLVGYTVPERVHTQRRRVQRCVHPGHGRFPRPLHGPVHLQPMGTEDVPSLGNNITWDGTTFAGEPCVPGTYFYLFNVNGMTFEGSVLLNR